jgi:hypothetical protein
MYKMISFLSLISLVCSLLSFFVSLFFSLYILFNQSRKGNLNLKFFFLFVRKHNMLLYNFK